MTKGTWLEGGPRNFDVICVGETTWKLGPAAAAAVPRLRPSGGVVNVALRLRRQGLRVGLATVLADDANGRAACEAIAASGVDVTGVKLARARPGLIMMDARGGVSPRASDLEERPPLEVPEGWSGRLVLLSGLSPVISHAAALCRAARRARRDGSLVLIDFNAALHAWAGRDARTVRMVLREVDVARCSIADLAVLGMDIPSVRGALRSSATLIVSEPGGRVVATGPFGEVVFAPPGSGADGALLRDGAGDALMAAICEDLAGCGEPGESPTSFWYRALQRGHSLGPRSSSAIPGARC